MTKKNQELGIRWIPIYVVAVAFCLFLWPALLSLHPGDWPSPHQYPHNDPVENLCGVVGAYLAYHLYHLIGDGAYPLLLFLSFSSITKLVRGEIGSLSERLIGLTLVVVCTAASTHLISAVGSGLWPEGHGGLIGFALGELLRSHLDNLGTFIVLAASFFVGLLFVTEGWVLKLPTVLLEAGRLTGRALVAARDTVATIPMPRLVAAGATLDESDALLTREHETTGRQRERKNERNDQTTAVEEVDEADLEESDNLDAVAATGGEPSVVERVRKALGGTKKPKKPAGPIVNMPSAERVADEPYPRQIENWRLPSQDLLDEPTYDASAEREALVRKQAQVLEQTLDEFRLDARVVEIDTGPVITMFELKLGAGIKVAQIATLSNDIARALKAHAIRVVAPIPGKNTVGIEVPNLKKEAVRLRELMAITGSKASEMELPLFLGKDAGGAALVTDLTNMPHLLIAGTTGSGKSVCLNTIILSILMTKRPDHVKMIVIDPKMVEMSQFKDIPHLMTPIVTDMPRAQKVLEWTVGQMDERYALLAEARTKNIAAYNNLDTEELLSRLNPQTAEEKKRISTHLPYIVVVIDELADLMMTAAKEVEHHLSRLAQKSRAVGIHIIVATQRPEAKIVTGLIKSNLPSRICFRVASRMDSRIVLDQNGGEVLLGEGDMLFLPPGSHKLLRAQGTYLSEREIHVVLEDLQSRTKPEYHPELTRILMPTHDSGVIRDPLFDKAVRVVVDSQRGSVSLLQRRLTVGYSRASRLIDQMAEAGIVGIYKGSQAREVLMTLDQWDALKQQVAEDLDAGYAADNDELDDDDSKESWDPDKADSPPV